LKDFFRIFSHLIAIIPEDEGSDKILKILEIKIVIRSNSKTNPPYIYHSSSTMVCVNDDAYVIKLYSLGIWIYSMSQ